MRKQFIKFLKSNYNAWLNPNKYKYLLNDRATKPIIYIIYSILIIDTNIKNLALLLITKFGNHPIILSWPWIKKYNIIINITNNSIGFWSNYCIYIGATYSTILNQLRLPIETVAIKIKKDITSWKTIKKGLKEVSNFL